MKKFTRQEVQKICDKNKFPGTLSIREQLNVMGWSIINRKRFNFFISRLEQGQSNMFAYIDASNLNK